MTLADITKLTEKTIAGLKIERVSQVTQSFNMLVYGNSGVGKTTLAGSSAAVKEMSPVLLVDIEGGNLSLKKTYPDVEVVRVKTWDQMQDVYDELHRGKSGYRTVIIDSLTEVQWFSMAGVMDEMVAKAKREGDDRDPDIPSQREWGKNINQVRKFVRAFRDLDVNTIFTALAKSDKDPRSGLNLTKPSLPGKLANEVPGFIDEVMYLYIKKVENDNKRLLLTSATDTEQAKDRSGLFENVVENPTMASLYATLTSKENN